MTVTDDEYEFLKSAVGTDGTLADLRMAYFKAQTGQDGTLADLELAFLQTNSTDDGDTINDLKRSYKYWETPPVSSPATFQYSNAAGSIGSTSKTWSAVPIGDAAANRTVVVLMGGRAAYILNSLTIGGVLAEIILSHSDSGLWFGVANVPAGTTADIVATWSAAQTRAMIGVWTINAAFGADPWSYYVDARSYDGTGLINTANGAITFAASYWTGLLGTTAWPANWTEDDTNGVDGNAMSWASFYNDEAVASLSMAPSNSGGGLQDVLGVSLLTA